MGFSFDQRNSIRKWTLLTVKRKASNDELKNDEFSNRFEPEKDERKVFFSIFPLKKEEFWFWSIFRFIDASSSLIFIEVRSSEKHRKKSLTEKLFCWKIVDLEDDRSWIVDVNSKKKKKLCASAENPKWKVSSSWKCPASFVLEICFIELSPVELN